MQSRETQITMVKWTNAGGQTKRANERSFVYRPLAWRRWRNLKTTYEPHQTQNLSPFHRMDGIAFHVYVKRNIEAILSSDQVDVYATRNNMRNSGWSFQGGRAVRTHYQFQSTPRNIRNLFKIANVRFPFLSFILGLISNQIACFQANLALLILQCDYSRGRQNIIRLLSLPVSRGGRLDLPLVWLCFCSAFCMLNCFCGFEEQRFQPCQLKNREVCGAA